MIRYALAPRAVIARARALAAWNAAATAAPAWLVVMLVGQLGLAPRAWMLGVAAAIAALAVLRALAEYGGARRRLAAFAIEADDAGLALRTSRAELRIARGAITRAAEIGGPLGGVRLFLAGDDLPSRVDVPRGGDAFGELRALVASWAPLDPPRRRGRMARVALAAIVVAGLFFLPFVIDDVRGSRAGVVVILVAAWLALRWSLSRG